MMAVWIRRAGGIPAATAVKPEGETGNRGDSDGEKEERAETSEAVAGAGEGEDGIGGEGGDGDGRPQRDGDRAGDGRVRGGEWTRRGAGVGNPRAPGALRPPALLWVRGAELKEGLQPVVFSMALLPPILLLLQSPATLAELRPGKAGSAPGSAGPMTTKVGADGSTKSSCVPNGGNRSGVGRAEGEDQGRKEEGGEEKKAPIVSLSEAPLSTRIRRELTCVAMISYPHCRSQSHPCDMDTEHKRYAERDTALGMSSDPQDRGVGQLLAHPVERRRGRDVAKPARRRCGRRGSGREGEAEAR